MLFPYLQEFQIFVRFSMVFKDVRLEFTKFGDNLQKYSEVYDLAISCWISSVVHRELWIISGIAHLSTLSSINWNRRVEQGYLFLCGQKKDLIHKGGSTNITDHFQRKRGQYYAKYRNKKEVLGILELTFSDKEVSAIDVSEQIGLS